MPDELATILHLVAEGILSPEEAAPIIDALSRAARVEDDAEPDRLGHDRLGRHAARIDRHVARAARRVDRALGHARARIDEVEAGLSGISGGRHLRIRVTEHGRQVVNLSIPIGFVDGALSFVPGIGGDQAERIREAVRSGATGPILDVEEPDGSGGVSISVE
jgi:hypothetical protein